MSIYQVITDTAANLVKVARKIPAKLELVSAVGHSLTTIQQVVTPGQISGCKPCFLWLIAGTNCSCVHLQGGLVRASRVRTCSADANVLHIASWNAASNGQRVCLPWLQQPALTFKLCNRCWDRASIEVWAMSTPAACLLFSQFVPASARLLAEYRRLRGILSRRVRHCGNGVPYGHPAAYADDECGTSVCAPCEQSLINVLRCKAEICICTGHALQRI